MRRVLYFTAEWCGPCRMFGPIVSEFPGVEKIDVDTRNDLARQYNVRNIPTIIIVENDFEIKRHVGATTKEILNQFLNL